LPKKFLLFDIDDTIATFDHESGMASLQKHIRDKRDIFDEALAQKIYAFMNTCFLAFHGRALGRETEESKKLYLLIQEAAQKVEGLENFSDIHWSRELWIYIAGGGSISPATAVEAAHSFWKGLALAAVPYDARKFFRWLNKSLDGYNYKHSPTERWKTIFVTSSDARLKANHDNTTLLYDPDHSNTQKFIRVNWIIPNSPFGSSVFIGDPVSKPHPDFWQRVIEGIGYNQAEDLAIMTGDSPRSDLTGLDQFGIVPILIDREGNFTPQEVPQAKYVISSLEDLKNIMAIEEINKKEGGTL